MTVSLLNLELVIDDVRCQPRETVDPRVVADYADDMRDGAEFPPLTVYHDGETYWLADGFHRRAAAQQAGLAEISCDVCPGSIRDAVLYAVGANAAHGFRRSNVDKRRAVRTLLNDPEWSGWSDREIARRCGVHHDLVGTVRQTLSGGNRQIERTVERNGAVYQMDTAQIGTRGRQSVFDEHGVEVDPIIPLKSQPHSTVLAPIRPQEPPCADHGVAELVSRLIALVPVSNADPKAVAQLAATRGKREARKLLADWETVASWQQEVVDELRRLVA